MVKKVIHSLTTIALAAYLLVFSTGFTLYTHYCSKDKQLQIALSQIDDPCTPTAEVKSCCAKPTVAVDKPGCSLNESCCVSDQNYWKLKLDYSSQKTDYQLEQIFVPVAYEFSIGLIHLNEVPAYNTANDRGDPPPLVHSGRVISISHQVFRC